MSKKDDEFIKTAIKRFKQAAEYSADNRERQLDDLRFLALEQWPDELKRARENDPNGARPCLVMDKVNQYVNQIINSQREARPAPKVRPEDDDADVDTAKILQGVMRNIMDKSSADIAIDTAFESAVKAGEGYFRVITEFEDEMSFNQEIKVKRIRNHFSVYLDPFSQEPDGSDAKWGFVTEEMSQEEFKLNYPKAEPVDWEQASLGDAEGWISEETVRVAEYFHVEEKEVEIVRLSKGAVVKAEMLEKFGDDVPEGITVIESRKTTIPQIKW